MCFGVRDALQIADQVADPTQVTIHGELVHNPRVIQQLDVAGFVQSSEAGRDAVPETPMVLITAHGVSDRERQRLNSSGKKLIDTTCPLCPTSTRCCHATGRTGATCAADWKAGAC